MKSKLDRIDAAALATNPRARLVDWKRYEPIILAAMEIHPRPYVYHPTNMSPATISSRIRDAVKGKIAFDHNSTKSADEVRHWFGEVIFKHDATTLYIGPFDRVRALISGEDHSTPLTGSVPFSFHTLSCEELTAFAILLSSGRITGPVICKIPPPGADLINWPEDNLEVLPKSDGSLVLM